MSKDPSEASGTEFETDCHSSDDDALITDWIQEAQNGITVKPMAQSSPIDEYGFDDFDAFTSMSDANLMNELHPYSNDDLESFLL